MRRLTICALLGLAASFAMAQTPGAQLLEKFGKALNSAKSLKVTYTVQVIGGLPVTYKIDLAKPNMMRIDAPNQLLVADGVNITTYDKKLKTYFKKKQSQAELAKILGEGDFLIWLPFFDNSFISKLKSVKTQNPRVKKNVTYNVVEFILPGSRPTKATYLLSQTDSIVRHANFLAPNGNTTEQVVLETAQLSVGDKDPDAKYYAFVAPEGSRELTEAEMSAGRWYTNLDEAIEVAAKTNKVVLAYFGADW